MPIKHKINDAPAIDFYVQHVLLPPGYSAIKNKCVRIHQVYPHTTRKWNAPPPPPPHHPFSFLAVKSSLQASAAFVILGILATFVSMVLYFPLWHYGFFIAGAALAIASRECGRL